PVGSCQGPVSVDHRDGLSRRQRPKSTGCVRADFVEVHDPESGQWVHGQVEVPRVTPAFTVTAGGNPESNWKFTVCDVVSLARKKRAVWGGLLSRHIEQLITSPGRTGRLVCEAPRIENWLVTF